MNQNTQALIYDTQSPSTLSEAQKSTIQEAIGILESTLQRADSYTSSELVRDFCRLKLAEEKDEHFGCLFLDNQHRLIHYETLFKGTIDGAAIYPRVVVRRALELNSAAIIFAHNHPAGHPEPSQADVAITSRLTAALQTVDIRTLDHIVVGSEGTISMAERGLI